MQQDSMLGFLMEIYTRKNFNIIFKGDTKESWKTL